MKLSIFMETLLVISKVVARHTSTVQNGQEVQVHHHQAAQAQAHHHHQAVHQVQAQVHQAAAQVAQNQWKMENQDQMKFCHNNVSVKLNVTMKFASQRGRSQHAQISSRQLRLITNSLMSTA